MSLEKLIAVSGKGGVYKMLANRNNGLILKDLDNGKKFFASGRSHQFTPLESISIYTNNEEKTVSLADVFSNMKAQIEENPPISTKSKGNEIKTYFAEVLPEYDRHKVLISDIKKIIKWFNFLNERDLLVEEETAAEEEE